MKISYGANGNIDFKSNVGNYVYSNDERPHAVMTVDNSVGLIPNSTLSTSFNDLNKIETIMDDSANCKMQLQYGPDRKRWYSCLSKNGQSVRSTIYAGDYEKNTEDSITREFYYMHDNTILIRQDGTLDCYHVFQIILAAYLPFIIGMGLRFSMLHTMHGASKP